jgi:hypothetical protein
MKCQYLPIDANQKKKAQQILEPSQRSKITREIFSSQSNKKM